MESPQLTEGKPLTPSAKPKGFNSFFRLKRNLRSEQPPPLQLYKGPLDHLLDEENLFQAWRASRRTGTDETNKWVPFGITTAVFVLLMLAKPTNAVLVAQWENWLSIMSGFTVTMLGFLVSRFAIFSSMNRPNLFAVMAKVADRDAPEFSYLKGIFLRLLRVFAEYWFIIVAILLLQMLTKRDAPLFMIVDQIRNSNTKNLLLIVAASASIWVFVYALMLLQSFIFNIYQFVMTCVVCDVGDYEISKEKQETHK